jgi:TolB-like protein
MKHLASILVACLLAACATVDDPESKKSSAFTRANYEAIDSLMNDIPAIDRKYPILIATMVDIDALERSSRLGRLVSEQISTRLTQLGYGVVEMRLRNGVYIREGEGELLLSRDVRVLSQNHSAQVVIVGSYAAAANHVYLTLKAVTPANNRVIAATNYLLPLTENTRTLLSAIVPAQQETRQP